MLRTLSLSRLAARRPVPALVRVACSPLGHARALSTTGAPSASPMASTQPGPVYAGPDAPSSSAPVVLGPQPLEALETVPIPVLDTVPVPVLAGGVDEAARAVADLSARDGGWLFARPMAACEWVLLGVNEMTGLPWWGSIVLSTVVARSLMVPLQVMQSRSTARMTAIKPQMDVLGAKMKAAYAKKTTEGFDEAGKIQLELQKLMSVNKVKPWTTLISVLGTIPVWMTFFFTLRMMMHRDGVGMAEGGALWFSDLTQADPYYVLPTLCGGTFFAMVQLGDAGQAGGKLDAQQQNMRLAMKGVSLLMVPMTASFESGIFVYWISSNMLSITQTVMLRKPGVRKLVGMPPIPRQIKAEGSGGSLLDALPAGLKAKVAAPPKAAAPEIFIPKPEDFAVNRRGGKGKGGSRKRRSR